MVNAKSSYVAGFRIMRRRPLLREYPYIGAAGQLLCSGWKSGTLQLGRPCFIDAEELDQTQELWALVLVSYS